MGLFPPKEIFQGPFDALRFDGEQSTKKIFLQDVPGMGDNEDSIVYDAMKVCNVAILFGGDRGLDGKDLNDLLISCKNRTRQYILIIGFQRNERKKKRNCKTKNTATK